MTRRTTRPTTLGPRAREIVAAARTLLEDRGTEALTLRTLADSIGIRAPSLYNHFPDKASLEAALVASGLFELALALEAAGRDTADPVASICWAYRSYAQRHPHLYRLMADRPTPSELLPDGLEERAYAPILAACGGDVARAVAVRGLAHGLALLETAGMVPPGPDLDGAWQVGIGG